MWNKIRVTNLRFILHALMIHGTIYLWRVPMTGWQPPGL